jgi:hypothetical protein
MAAAGSQGNAAAEVNGPKKLELEKFGGYDSLQVKADCIVEPITGQVQVAVKTGGVVRDCADCSIWYYR